MRRKKKAKRYASLEQATLKIWDEGYPDAILCAPIDCCDVHGNYSKRWYWVITDGKNDYCVAEAGPYGKKWNVLFIDNPILMKNGMPTEKLRERSTEGVGRPKKEKCVSVRTPIGVKSKVVAMIKRYKEGGQENQGNKKTSK